MTTVAPLADFPDRLSPMVVKELRQGLRTRLFGGVMLVLHVLLVLLTLMGEASSRGREVWAMMDGLLGFVLCVIFPLSGFSAVSGEMKSNTMDMLVLTRLSAGRIVMGKWASIIFQSLLVTVSVLPYQVARYVYGGSDMIQDIFLLVRYWLVSAVLTAAVVALSTQKQFWLRALFIFLPMMLSNLLFSRWMFRSVLGGPVSGAGTELLVWRALGWGIGGAWLIFALLSFGASRIAPAASMLPVIKRLVNLVALPVLAGLEWFASGKSSVTPLVCIVLVVASVDALTDDLRKLPSIYLPFYRRGWLGRLAGLFLAPGWMHGLLYSFLLAGLGCGLVWMAGGRREVTDLWLISCGLWASSFFGHLLAIRRSGEYVGASFAGACVLAFFTMLVFMVSTSDRKEELKWLSCLFPFNTMALPSSGGGLDDFKLGLVLNALWPFLLLLLALRAFRLTRAARLEARKLV